LCHDDELEGRRIAYILYLVDDDWSSAGNNIHLTNIGVFLVLVLFLNEFLDGGTLDLFNVDERNQPDTIVTSLCPQWNSFAFFTVTPTSFHQVILILI